MNGDVDVLLTHLITALHYQPMDLTNCWYISSGDEPKALVSKNWLFYNKCVKALKPKLFIYVQIK